VNISKLILVIFIVALCSCGRNGSELRLPRTEGELKEFLVRFQAESQSRIVDEQKQGIQNGVEMVIIPAKLNLTVDGLGILWERTILGEFTSEQIDALKVVAEVPYEYMSEYCQPPSIDWMRDFEYRIYEKLYTESGATIRDFEVNIHACERYVESAQRQ